MKPRTSPVFMSTSPMSHVAPPVHPSFVTGLHSIPEPASFAATIAPTQLPPEGAVAGTVHSNGFIPASNPGPASPGPSEEPFDEAPTVDDVSTDAVADLDAVAVDLADDFAEDAPPEVAWPPPSVSVVPTLELLLHATTPVTPTTPSTRKAERSFMIVLG
jgi:hypothetical protein